jgi:hypothetical protein
MTVAPTENGGSRISLDPGEGHRVEVGDDGSVTIVVEPDNATVAPDVVLSEPLAERQRLRARSFAPRARELVVYANPDGSVTVGSTDNDNEVVAIGDPSTGLLELVEIPRRDDR